MLTFLEVAFTVIICTYVCVGARVWVHACACVRARSCMSVKGTYMQNSNLLYLHIIYVTKFGKPYTVQFIHEVLLI